MRGTHGIDKVALAEERKRWQRASELCDVARSQLEALYDEQGAHAGAAGAREAARDARARGAAPHVRLDVSDGAPRRELAYDTRRERAHDGEVRQRVRGKAAPRQSGR